jgi:hypothetical protein
MIVGIALFSVITGTLAQWFVRSSHTEGDAKDADITVTDSVGEIRALLEEQHLRYQQNLERLDARIAELEAQLKERG